MSAHLRERFGDSTSEARLSILVDLCDRQIDLSESGSEACLLCHEEIDLSRIHDHVGAHMEDIALFVLPIFDQGEGSDEAPSSEHAVKAESQSDYVDNETDTSNEKDSDDSGEKPLPDDEDDPPIKASESTTGKEEVEHQTPDEEVGYAAALELNSIRGVNGWYCCACAGREPSILQNVNKGSACDLCYHQPWQCGCRPAN